MNFQSILQENFCSLFSRGITLSLALSILAHSVLQLQHYCSTINEQNRCDMNYYLMINKHSQANGKHNYLHAANVCETLASK